VAIRRGSRHHPAASFSTRGYGVAIAASALLIWLLFWWAGLLNGKHDSAILTFLGTYLTVSISFIGLVIKEASDNRIAEEHGREERRLAAESAMKAAALFSTSTGQPSDSATAAGALLALSDLGQTELAISMLFDLWRDNRVAPSTAALLIQRALSHSSSDVQRDASVALSANVLKVVEVWPGGSASYAWPNCVDLRWLPHLDYAARNYLLIAWVQLWLFADGFTPAYREQQMVAGLFAIWQRELDPELRSFAAHIIRKAFDANPRFNVVLLINDRITNLDVAAIAEVSQSSEAAPTLADYVTVLAQVDELISSGYQRLDPQSTAEVHESSVVVPAAEASGPADPPPRPS
jgi:hypothetical protein